MDNDTTNYHAAALAHIRDALEVTEAALEDRDHAAQEAARLREKIRENNLRLDELAETADAWTPWAGSRLTPWEDFERTSLRAENESLHREKSAHLDAQDALDNEAEAIARSLEAAARAVRRGAAGDY